MTLTRSHMPATTPRSCVIRMSAVSWSATSSREDVEDLRLDRHVERRRGLVRDQELRLAGERHRDHRALAHAARELVRVVAQPRPRAWDADPVEQLGGTVVRRVLVHAEVRLEHLPDLTADRQHRIQARHRVLEDHRDLAAADPAQLLVGELEQVLPLELRGARGDPAGAGEDPEQGERRDALAAAGLADDPERLARRDVERDPVDGMDRAALGPELDLQVVDLDRSGSASLGTARAASGRAPRGARRRSG